MTNEAAERLLTLHREKKWLLDDDYEIALGVALAAERRVTVERIRELAVQQPFPLTRSEFHWIIEEAAR